LAQSLHCEPASDCNFGGFRSKGKVSVDARSLPQFGPNQPVLESVRTPDQVKGLEGPGLKVCLASERRTSIASDECAAGPVSQRRTAEAGKRPSRVVPAGLGSWPERPQD
jgi:hypothetical protein